MARILAISSQVVRGHVGLSAIVPALQRLGHEVLAMPTVLLSNHPGHTRSIGTHIEVNTLGSMLDVLDANGWLGGLDAVLTGYMPTPEHVFFAAQAIDRVRTRARAPMVLVDPVIGDDPKGVYVGRAAAEAIRKDLVPRADTLTPNRFELSWLSGVDVRSIAMAVEAGRGLKPRHVIATSIPDGSETLCNVIIEPDAAAVCRVMRQAHVPHGTGDLLSGLFTGHTLHGLAAGDALARSVASVQTAIAVSAGSSDMVLAIAPGAADWAASAPLALEHIERRG